MMSYDDISFISVSYHLPFFAYIMFWKPFHLSTNVRNPGAFDLKVTDFNGSV